MPSSPPLESIQIRPLHTHEELQACMELQHLTWGEDFLDAVPPSILIVSQRLGGVAAGAFDADGRMLGFVFGITGVERGRIVHWSDMLAVRPEVRNLGLAQRLKEHQRREALAVGATIMYWTYDPLVQRNAYLNLVRLGARISEYVVNMYGENTGSVLHRGLGTDRMVVAWALEDQEARAALGEAPDSGAAGVDLAAARINMPPEGAHVSPFDPPPAPPDAVRIEVPADIAEVQARSLDEAGAWRRSTRAAFQWALVNGYHVATFVRGQHGGNGSYVLRRAPA